MVAVDTLLDVRRGHDGRPAGRPEHVFGGRGGVPAGSPASGLRCPAPGWAPGWATAAASTVAPVRCAAFVAGRRAARWSELAAVQIGSMGDGHRGPRDPVDLDAMPQQLALTAQHVVTDQMAGRAAVEARPLRQIMAHPRFGFPVAAELLTRWPEWTVPGITEFPENRARCSR